MTEGRHWQQVAVEEVTSNDEGKSVSLEEKKQKKQLGPRIKQKQKQAKTETMMTASVWKQDQNTLELKQTAIVIERYKKKV